MKNGALNQGVYCSHCQLAVMGWQGGTIHQARKAMAQALQNAKKFLVTFRPRPNRTSIERELTYADLTYLHKLEVCGSVEVQNVKPI